ncbi:hypothetical protein BC832DRAFT_556076 [Gaertneriomyces semiglobifer]|nr:hypothetical protein BC832DRAFT_556076 [Gaertneriomyces semiglobifer]
MLSLHELETVYTHCLAAQMVDPARLASADEHATADIYDIPDEFYCPSDFLCLVHDVLRLSPGKHFVTLRDWKRDPEATLTVLRLMLGESNSGELLCYIEKSPNAPCSEDDTESSEHEDGESGFFIKGWKAWIEGEYRTLVGDGAESECDDVSDSCDGYEQECVHKN